MVLEIWGGNDRQESLFAEIWEEAVWAGIVGHDSSMV